MYNVTQGYINALDKPINDYKLKLKINGHQYDESVVLQGTLSLTNQCSEGDEVKIGSVYTGELRLTVKSGLVVRNTWENVSISVEEGMNIAPDGQPPTYEYVPLGTYYVAEANHVDEGVQLTAYDAMLKFDKTWNITSTMGSPFSILRMLCQDCRVSLGMTQAQIEALPNGTQPLALYSENDCQTYRDVLFWLAQTLASFCTIGRDGKLYLRQYTDAETDTIDERMRFEGSSFSDFVTRYSGIAFTDIDSQEYKYYHVEDDIYLTYNLGSNPFLQYGTESTRKQMALNILTALQKIRYTPFQTQYLNTPAYDLGDVIVNEGGIGDDSVGCIMLFEYNYSQGIRVEGFGANPALATARDKVDKDIAGLMSKTDKNSIQFYTFKNAEEVEIDGGDEEELINIRFTTMEARQVTFQAEILCDVDVNLYDVIGKIHYYLDGSEITDYYPTETWSEDGKHIINLYYMIDVEPNTLYRWQVMLESENGSITVPAESARGTIWGQGLVALTAWDGYIDAEDTLEAISLDSIGVESFTDEAVVSAQIPTGDEVEDEFDAIELDSIEVEEFEDGAYINRSSLWYEQITWGELFDDSVTWARVYDDNVW